MAYSELIKNFNGVRSYMRQFFVYGFKSREEFDTKSARSYDNEKRRIDSWLGEYMSFRQEAGGKAVFLSVDSRHVPRNPLYKAWKAASFTKNDIGLHFLLLDILSPKQGKTLPEILQIIDDHYLIMFSEKEPVNESTLRKKMKEYVDLGLITAEKQGKQLHYYLPEDGIDLTIWQDAISFFSEENLIGVVGSYLLDKYQRTPDIFSFKHHYLLFTLDCGIMLDLLSAINEHRSVELELFDRRGNQPKRFVALPLKIFVSTQGGRQYLAGFNMRAKKLQFYRLDSVQKVSLLDVQPDHDTYRNHLQDEQAHIWGVATGNGQLEHIEMILLIVPKDIYIAQRLDREKRCGAVTQLSEDTWRFTADVYDAQELMPWLRTFIGRIISLTCSDKIIEERFWSDYALMVEMYGGDNDAV